MSEAFEYVARGDGPCQAIVPLFPLANVWLFPGCIMPLHIFEPRYREMIEDSLDGPGRLALGTVAEGHEQEMPGSPPVYKLAGLGEIGWHERLPDGRFMIRLVGLARVELHERPSERRYRKVGLRVAGELPARAEEESGLRPRLLEAIRQRCGQQVNVAPDVPLSRLVDLLLLRLPLPHKCLQGLFGELDCAARARGALAEHERRSLRPGA